MHVPMVVVAEARDMEGKDREEEDRGKKSKPTYGRTNHPRILQPADCCPSHGKPSKKGVYFGMSILVREEERKKREVERVVVGELGFVRLLALWFTVRVQLLRSSALCGSVTTSLYAILSSPNWAQELCELKYEMET